MLFRSAIYVVQMKNSITSCFAYDSVKVTVNLLPTPKIVGDTAVCEGNTLTYSTASTTANTYNWKVTGGNIVSGQGTDIVNIKWPVAGGGMIEVVEKNVDLKKFNGQTVFIKARLQQLSENEYNVKVEEISVEGIKSEEKKGEDDSVVIKAKISEKPDKTFYLDMEHILPPEKADNKEKEKTK